MKREEITINSDEKFKQDSYIHKMFSMNKGLNKKHAIITFGCQMNENDSEKLNGMLTKMGYNKTEDTDEADFIIYNTCCVRENAELKVYGHLGALKLVKENKKDLIIAVCGCMMQQKEVVEHIKKTYRHVSLVFGTHNLFKLPEMLFDVSTTNNRVIQVYDTNGVVPEDLPIIRNDENRAYITIMYGCNNYCTYCIVPYVRGRERSRKVEDIISEFKELARLGYKEVTLLGQNVNSFGKDFTDGTTFTSLLRELNEVDGIERIRFTTSHPKDVSDDLIYAISDLKKVCNQLHLPFQSGSSKVLKEMNRVYTKENYLLLVDKIRKEVPNISFSTDIIVGFPGETEEDFEQTLDVVKKVKYDQAYMFIYSKRTGTEAAIREDQISDEIKKNRFERLLNIQNKICKEINLTYIGKIVEVLVESLSKNDSYKLTGRTESYKLVHFEGSKDLIGTFVKVKITEAKAWSLEGKIQN